ncbi:HCP-like protein [Rickenella mellea]|uniref:HCP-like protein n=1 Tax=Rickenella mellea TaxID=50990 RepID=A0A4Y7Q9C0_9AGAM|nr:HCP-like protein [Rickenella mellea]
MNPGPSRSPSYSQLSPRSQSSDPYSSNPNTPSASSPSLSPSVSTPKTFNSIPSRPDLGRSHTPAESVYSTYSYYELSPSPKQTTFPSGVSGPAPPDQQLTGSLQRNDGRNTSSSRLGHQQGAAQPGTPEEYVQLGISHHEANRLQESAYCFEKSATENGGCCVGMLMWGLSLRHGWGCAKDEPKAFRWLKRAAEHAVVDLQAAKEGKDVIKTELVLAVYEVGQSFFQGWGVERDQKMAVSYFETAAHLGDPDAQQDLAFCLANGKGCKKDRKAAAKWYRAAAAQGASTIGLAWIYKPKYMD